MAGFVVFTIFNRLVMDTLFTIPNHNINIITLWEIGCAVISGEGNVLFCLHTLTKNIRTRDVDQVYFYENWPWSQFFIEIPKQARHIVTMSVYWKENKKKKLVAAKVRIICLSSHETFRLHTFLVTTHHTVGQKLCFITLIVLSLKFVYGVFQF